MKIGDIVTQEDGTRVRITGIQTEPVERKWKVGDRIVDTVTGDQATVVHVSGCRLHYPYSIMWGENSGLNGIVSEHYRHDSLTVLQDTLENLGTWTLAD